MKKKKKCVHVIKFSYTLPVEVKISKTNVCILLLRVCDVCVYIYEFKFVSSPDPPAAAHVR